MVSKFKLFVAAYSVVLLSLFGVFCFLMTTVDPIPKENTTVITPSLPTNPDHKDEPSMESYGLFTAPVKRKAVDYSMPNEDLILLYRILKERNAFVEDPLVVDVEPPTMRSDLKNDDDVSTTQSVGTLTMSSVVDYSEITTLTKNLSNDLTTEDAEKAQSPIVDIYHKLKNHEVFAKDPTVKDVSVSTFLPSQSVNSSTSVF